MNIRITEAERKGIIESKKDAMAAIGPIRPTEWSCLIGSLRLGYMDPEALFASLPIDQQRAILFLARYAAKRLEATENMA